MDRYIKVDWPDSQYFQEEQYSDFIYWCEDMIVFVPEDIYQKVMNNDN